MQKFLSKKLLILLIIFIFLCLSEVNSEAAEFNIGTTLSHTQAFRVIDAYLPAGTLDIKVDKLEFGALYGQGSTAIDWQYTEADAVLNRIGGAVRYYYSGDQFIGGRFSLLRGDIEASDGDTVVNGTLEGISYGPTVGSKFNLQEDGSMNVLLSLGYEYVVNNAVEEVIYNGVSQGEEIRHETVHRLIISGVFRIEF